MGKFLDKQGLTKYDSLIKGWAQNKIDEVKSSGSGGVTSWNDLEDKPFGETAGGDTLVWDGTYNPDELVADMFVRISDAVPTASDLANGITVRSSAFGDESLTFPGEELLAGILEDGFLAADALFIIPYDGYEADGMSFPKAGIYTVIELPDLAITIPGYTGFGTLKKLDAKYLPDWNDWEDKPFGEVPSDTLVCDDSYNPDETVAGMLARVSDAVPTASDLANGMVISSGGMEELMPGEDLVPSFQEDGFFTIGFMLTFVPYDGYTYNDQEDGVNFVFPKAGVYLHIDMMPMNITIPGYTGFTAIKKIDKKYIPDMEHAVKKTFYTLLDLDDNKYYLYKETWCETEVTTEDMMEVINKGYVLYIDENSYCPAIVIGSTLHMVVYVQPAPDFNPDSMMFKCAYVKNPTPL